MNIYNIVPHDKCLHFIAGVCIFAVLNLINPFVALAAVCAIGFAKEIYDRNRTGFSFKDLAFTIAGGLVGLFISIGG